MSENVKEMWLNDLFWGTVALHQKLKKGMSLPLGVSGKVADMVAGMEVDKVVDIVRGTACVDKSAVVLAFFGWQLFVWAWEVFPFSFI